jgi:hypothetical protein
MRFLSLLTMTLTAAAIAIPVLIGLPVNGMNAFNEPASQPLALADTAPARL